MATHLISGDATPTAGTYGDTTHTPVVTVNANGLVTGITLATISGGGGSSSVIGTGTSDPSSPSEGQLFYRTDLQALKIYTGGIWYTIAEVSFDSLWDSATDLWDSNSMNWDSPS
jgi:hypothetical protein